MLKMIISKSIGMVFFLAVGSVFSSPVFEFGEAPAGYTRDRQARYSFTVENTANAVMDRGVLWVAIPFNQTATQWLLRVAATEAASLTNDAFGNGMLKFDLGPLPPFGSRVIKITADLKLADKPQPAGGKSEVRNPKSEIDSEITALAGKLKGASQSATAKNICGWVENNLKYSGFHAANRGALWALQNRKGDCTEYAALFTALCRANGIPARMLNGFVCPKNMILKPYSLHDWAEFYDGTTWIIADPEQKNFNARQADYIAFKVLEPAEADQRDYDNSIFRFDGPGLTARMDK